MQREAYDCPHGKVNGIIHNVWCNRFCEFCRFVDDCTIRGAVAERDKRKEGSDGSTVE